MFPPHTPAHLSQWSGWLPNTQGSTGASTVPAGIELALGQHWHPQMCFMACLQFSASMEGALNLPPCSSSWLTSLLLLDSSQKRNFIYRAPIAEFGEHSVCSYTFIKPTNPLRIICCMCTQIIFYKCVCPLSWLWPPLALVMINAKQPFPKLQ